MPVDLPVPSGGLPTDASFGVSVGESPTVGAVPFWVTACLLFDPPPVAAANSVSTAVAVLMAAAVRVHGDLMVKLSPTRLALLCGYERPEKAKWITDYLQRIGFLQVMDGGVNAATGRRQARRDGAGRAIENEFVVFPSAPEHYRGPRSLAELDRWISADIDAAEQAPGRGGRRSGRPRSVSIRRRTLFAVPAGQGHTPARGDGAVGLPPARGEGSISAGQAHPPRGGDGCSPFPPARGGGGVCAGQALPPARGVLQIERSSISLEEREIEEIEPVPGGSAPPPATGPAAAAGAGVGLGGVGVAVVERPAALLATAVEDPAVRVPVEQVRGLVRRLPWAAWAALRRPGWRPSTADADQVQAAITEAITGHGITLDQATEIGQAALSEAKGPQPVTYLVNAFTRHLSRRLRALDVEPLDDTPLPLLTPTEGSEPFSRPQKRSPGQAKAVAAAAAQQAVQGARAALRDRGAGCAACDDNGIAHDPVYIDGHPRSVRCTHDTSADTAADTAAGTAVERSDDPDHSAARAAGDGAASLRPGPATSAGRASAMAMIRAHLGTGRGRESRGSRRPGAGPADRSGTVEQ
ncbi:hypothetical protein [Pseudonocardia sp. ICBG601]|uniref:hypothetical protein n=1 Tax=Pseudonocardia sp. ICBG601 TaxID=2846759 RepID=UPI001CF717FC|nr:hypothetical protein [Pseudonocardia sp. ICBG601]